MGESPGAQAGACLNHESLVIALGGGQDTEIDQPATVDDLVVATVVDRWAYSPWIADLFTWHRTAALWEKSRGSVLQESRLLSVLYLRRMRLL